MEWHMEALRNGSLAGPYGRGAILKIQRHIKKYMTLKGA